jgi:o-succinylbenzoate synthase
MKDLVFKPLAAIKIDEIELREIELSLNFRFETSYGSIDRIRRLIVIIRGSGLTGFGECTAGKTPGYCYETVDTSRLVLEKYAIPRVLGKSFENPQSFLNTFGGIRGHNMAIAGLETAFWDLYSKTAEKPLWELLGGNPRPLPVGASLGIEKSIEETLNRAREHAELGYRRLKFKIKPGWDVQVIKAVRKEFPGLALSVDANSAYKLEDAPLLAQMDDFNLEYIEQPLSNDDIIDHATLQKKLKTPICLDESIHSADDTRKALEIGAARVINIKLGRVRGHGEARKIQELCLKQNIPCWCGGMLETGIGRAHNLHMTTLPGFTLPGDTASASRYWKEDIVEPSLEAVDGFQAVPEGPGIGVTIKQDLLDRVTQCKSHFD